MRQRPEPPDAVSPDETIARSLRWLLGETRARAAALLRVGQDGSERLTVEPRGIEGPVVAELARKARARLGEASADGSGIAWFGAVGWSAIVLDEPEEPYPGPVLRFARFLIDWTRVPESDSGATELERSVRDTPGVSWVELDESGLRVLLSDESASTEVSRLAEAAGVAVQWVGTAGGEVPPDPRSRVQLEDVIVVANGEAEARVRLVWGGRTIVGSGHGEPSASGRLHAAAEAVVDALRPFVSDLRLEGIYAATTADGVPLLMVSVLTGDDLLVGAVSLRPEEEALGAAKAVLDAINRRLPRLLRATPP